MAKTDPKSDAEEAGKKQPPNTAAEWGKSIVIALALFLFLRTFLVQTFVITSGSMEETLLVGDHLVVDRFVYGPAPTAIERAVLPLRSVRRGDIVVFRSPRQPELDLVKRCVALPGDLVEIRNKVLVLNGKPLEEPYVQHADRFTGGVDSWHPDRIRRDQMPPFRVPPGHYFCLGDNRDQSLDSRFWGPVPAHLVKGRAGWIYWSYGGEPPPVEWQGLVASLRRWGRTLLGFFADTRWERTFHLPG
jgi:signal peptidase I